MDWARAIERNSEALKGIVEALFAMLGLAGEDTVARIPQPLHRAVLRVLRPAESAMRRLIVIAARGLVVKLAPSRPMPKGPDRKGGGRSRPSFQLFDPRKNFAELRQHRVKYAKHPPRIHFFGDDSRVDALWPAPQPAAAPAPAARWPRQCRTPHPEAPGPQARARGSAAPGQASRPLAGQAGERAKAPKFKSPLRPGHPPGYRRKPVHEVDEVLTECHGLACDAMRPDTSLT